MQQYLPFTVLKLQNSYFIILKFNSCNSTYRLRYWNPEFFNAALGDLDIGCNSTYRLRYWNFKRLIYSFRKDKVLQQYLPFTVLKHLDNSLIEIIRFCVVTAPTVYGIETQLSSNIIRLMFCCNSTYHLWYWNVG